MTAEIVNLDLYRKFKLNVKSKSIELMPEDINNDPEGVTSNVCLEKIQNIDKGDPI